MAIIRRPKFFPTINSVVTKQALVFPSNVSGADTAAPLVALKFLDPQNNGLPALGPSSVGTTWIWRAKYRQHTGYYVTFWWAQGNTGFDPGKAYYGCHPYPNTGTNAGTVHDWEIAASVGGDYRATRVAGGTTFKQVVKDTWFTQALRVDANGGSPKLILYTALPSVADADVIEITLGAGVLDSANYPLSPILMIGDSPWYAGYQHERLGGSLSEMKIFAKLLTQADTLSEAATLSSLVTTEGQANIWWGKNNFPTVDSLTCNYGTGRSFFWADAANKATLGDA